MQKYKNLGGDSGVSRYEIGEDFIEVEFQDGKKYRYDYKEPGKEHVEHMKKLAALGRGLNSYIGKHIKKNYVKKY